MAKNEELLGQLKRMTEATGSLEPGLVHECQPHFRSPAQYTFSPALVAKMAEQRSAIEEP